MNSSNTDDTMDFFGTELSAVLQEGPEELARAVEEAVEAVAWRWDLQEELPETLQVGIGPEPTADENRITLPDPDDYRENMLGHHVHVPEVADIVESHYPVPVHPVVEEAGHYVSQLPERVSREPGDGLGDIVANELFGALALGHYDDRLLENQEREYRNNLEVLEQMYDDSHVDYVVSNLPDMKQDVDEFSQRLRGEAQDVSVVEDIMEGRRSLLEDAPNTSRDFEEYSHPGRHTPQSYSEWFVDQMVYGFWPVLASLNREEDADVDRVFDRAGRAAEEHLDRIQDWGEDEIRANRNYKHVSASKMDRGYLASRRLAGDVLDRSLDADFSTDPSSLVRMTNYELYRELEDYIGGTDRELREQHDVPFLDLPGEDITRF